MRRRRALRQARLAHAAVGATVIAIPAAAAALAEAAPATNATPPAGSSGLKVRLQRHRIAYGSNVVVTGSAPASDSGQTVTLGFRGAADPGWRMVASSLVGADGRFRLAAPLRQSGAVTVTGSWQAQQPPSITATAGAAADGAGAGSSGLQQVTVAARLRLRAHAFEVLGQRRVTVRGKLLPGAGGRRVRLQMLRAGRWQTLSAGRTGRRGGFALSFAAGGSGRERLRVLFSGDRTNGRTSRGAGTVTYFAPSVASWYSDGGATACGFHAYYGVASPSLPCGAHVTFSYGGRTVTAVVDDRGPYVSGRQWDLNQNTAAALGFGGVDTVWYALR